MGQPCLNRMLINPIFLENTAFTKDAHKLLVHGVYDWKKPVKEEAFDEVKGFCKENHIVFTIREFMPQNIAEDREQIEKLPAFQIYLEGNYQKTAYPEDAVKSIREILTDLYMKPQSVGWTFPFPKFTFTLRRKNRIISYEPT